MKLTHLETIQTGGVFDIYLGVEFPEDDPCNIEYPALCLRYDGEMVVDIAILDGGLPSFEWELDDAQRQEVIDFVFNDQDNW
jgi:hypothetical protein